MISNNLDKYLDSILRVLVNLARRGYITAVVIAVDRDGNCVASNVGNFTADEMRTFVARVLVGDISPTSLPDSKGGVS